jgi:maltose O-acetyltransferase
MKHRLLLLYSWLIRIVLFCFPDMPLVMRFRGWLYGLAMQHCGKDFWVTHDAILKDLENIRIGDHVFIGNGAFVMGNVTIEDEVQIAMHSVIVSSNHTSQNGSYRYGKSDFGQTCIHRGAWVAANCTIIKGGELPENSVLAANSCLTTKMERPDSIYGGVPAKFIKKQS